MVEGSIITDALKKLVGWSTDPVIFRVEEGAIQRYADAIGDPNPLFNDLGYAKKSKYGRLICPPGFNGWPANSKVYDPLKLPASLIMAGAPLRVLDGGIEYEFLEPIGAGDILTFTAKIVDIAERESKSGKMLITTVETTFINQDGNVAVKGRMTTINR